MQLVNRAIKDPVSVIVAVLLVTLFGLIALFRFPIQLTPNVDLPVINVTTTWLDASPQEVEQEIVKRQEEKLRSLRGLRKMTSESQRSRATIRLEFQIGTDINRARIDVSDMLRQVTDYPEEADEPIVESGEQEEGNMIAWLILRSERDDVFVPHMQQLVDDFVLSRLRRVPGVSRVRSFGGQERQAQIRLNMAALAARKLSPRDVQNAVASEDLNVTAGDLAEGKLDYQIRAQGQFQHLRDVEQLVVAQHAGGPVYVKDVADVTFGYKEPEFRVRHKGDMVIAFGVSRQVGANVIEAVAGIRQAVTELNQNVLKDKGVHLEQVYDETDYIYSAIGLVRGNFLLGGLLAAVVMLVFLRAGRPTLVVAVSIPISVIGTFLVMSLLGRNLNVISLAGMAFAVGMVVDNAIVVLENIFRHRQSGEDVFQAAYNGAVEVWGAVLASTLTTVAVFLPVVFIEQEAGQLFRDIAIAISAGVSLSLLVSLTVIPMLSARLLKNGDSELATNRVLAHFNGIGRRASAGILRLLNRILDSVKLRLATIFCFIGVALVGSWLLIPPASYLPIGNRNLVFVYMILPPGYSVEEGVRIGQQMENVLRPYWQAELGSEEAKKLPFPPVDEFFYVTLGHISFMGLTAKDPSDAKAMIPLAESVFRPIPAIGMWGFASQPPMFGQQVGGRGNTIDVEISGNDINQVAQIGKSVFLKLMTTKELPGMFPIPTPANFMLDAPEGRFEPDREKLARAGVAWQDVALTMAAVVDGATVGDFYDRGKKLDLVLRGSAQSTEHTPDILQVPVYTGRAGVVPLGNLINYVPTTAQQQINHIEELPAVSLSASAPPGMALQETMDVITQKVIEPMKQSGQIPGDINVRLSGTADKLVDTGRALAGGFILAMVITYLLMSSLFGSFVYPLIIMLSVPLAAVGGFAGLRIVHTITGQEMDVITMLGFVILIGVVVNNAILIVYQALHLLRRGANVKEALLGSVQTRLRPIYMSASTTIFAMLPLVIVPGSGSELYRGLGAVIVGGLAISTIFTVFLIPSLFSLLPERWIPHREDIAEHTP